MVRGLRLALFGTLALALPACRVAAPRGDVPAPTVPADSSSALAEYISTETYLTVEPAYRAAYALWRGEVFAGDFAALTEELESAKLIKARWDYPPDGRIDRASAGYLLARAAGVRSGVNWRLTGLGRYAWRELIYLGIASPSSEYGYVPGGQFAGMLVRAEDYMARRRAAAVERIELGTPP